jgi:hypothetical protein
MAIFLDFCSLRCPLQTNKPFFLASTSVCHVYSWQMAMDNQEHPRKARVRRGNVDHLCVSPVGMTFEAFFGWVLQLDSIRAPIWIATHAWAMEMVSGESVAVHTLYSVLRRLTYLLNTHGNDALDDLSVSRKVSRFLSRYSHAQYWPCQRSTRYKRLESWQ